VPGTSLDNSTFSFGGWHLTSNDTTGITESILAFSEQHQDIDVSFASESVESPIPDPSVATISENEEIPVWEPNKEQFPGHHFIPPWGEEQDFDYDETMDLEDDIFNNNNHDVPMDEHDTNEAVDTETVVPEEESEEEVETHLN
jgi:hypothetical protein